jgi:hypothetical protein
MVTNVTYYMLSIFCLIQVHCAHPGKGLPIRRVRDVGAGAKARVRYQHSVRPNYRGGSRGRSRQKRSGRVVHGRGGGNGRQDKRRVSFLGVKLHYNKW